MRGPFKARAKMMSLRWLRRFAGLAAYLAVLELLSTAVLAQRLGAEFQVNTYTTGLQIEPAIGADALGNFVVVWRSGHDGPGWGVFGQRFDSAGQPAGREFLVPSETAQTQWQPKVAMFGQAEFVTTWSVYEQPEVFGRRFDGAGLPLANDFQVNSYTFAQQNTTAVAARSAGDFVVVWNSYWQDSSVSGVFGQRFGATGAPEGNEFQVNTYTMGSQTRPSVAFTGPSEFVVVWSSGSAQDGSDFGVFGQRFSTAGAAQGAEFQINSYTTGSQYGAVVASAGSGEFVVAWRSDGQDGDGLGIFGQRFDSSGAPAGSEFRVNTYTPGTQDQPVIAADGGGDFVVVWQGEYSDGSTLGLVGQRFDSQGIRIGGEFQVNTYTTGFQHEAAIAAAGEGKFVVAWTSYPHQDGSYRGVFGQRLQPPLFADGFEAADACSWSVAAGGGCP